MNIAFCRCCKVSLLVLGNNNCSVLLKELIMFYFHVFICLFIDLIWTSGWEGSCMSYHPVSLKINFRQLPHSSRHVNPIGMFCLTFFPAGHFVNSIGIFEVCTYTRTIAITTIWFRYYFYPQSIRKEIGMFEDSLTKYGISQQCMMI